MTFYYKWKFTIKYITILLKGKRRERNFAVLLDILILKYPDKRKRYILHGYF